MINPIEKSIARYLAISLTPECAGVLSDFRTKSHGWVRMPDEIEGVLNKLNLGAYYVIAYEDELRIHGCLYKALFPSNTVEEIKKWDAEFAALSEEEKLSVIKEDVNIQLNDLDFRLEDFFPKTDEMKAAAQARYDELSDEEKKDTVFRLAMFVAYFYSFFYNTLSLMVHGQKLTTLVPLAMRGDKEAFCKAVQIDRNLLTGHPYFRDTYAKLQAGEDSQFLKDVLYRIGNPTTRGKIRFPALYMVFALLDNFGRLDDFTASEILDICDEAKLDRFQNRIEDENYLNKQRQNYRRWQMLPK